MNRRKSVLLAVMILCMGVLLFNWFLQTSPQSAPAAELAAADFTTLSSSLSPAVGSLPSALRITRAPFPELPAVVDGDRFIRNIFVPPQQIVTTSNGESSTHSTASSSSNNGSQPSAPRAAFQELHQLLGVMNSATVALALVDDQWLEVGDTLDDCQLIHIESDQAVFRCIHGETTLTLNTE